MAEAGPVFGLSNRDICSDDPGDARAPFTAHPGDGTAVHAVLMNNDSEKQACMLFEPDGTAVPKPGAPRGRVESVARTATRLHVNRTCRYTSQRVLFPYTAKPTLASRVFPSVAVPQEHEKAAAVWGNSALGLICFWAHAGKQQIGRGQASRTSMARMPVLDVAMLGKRAVAKLDGIFDGIFDEYCGKNLLPMNLCYRDENRSAMDAETLCALGADESIDDVRIRFCREPLVRGGRKDPELDRAAGAP